MISVGSDMIAALLLGLLVRIGLLDPWLILIVGSLMEDGACIPVYLRQNIHCSSFELGAVPFATS